MIAQDERATNGARRSLGLCPERASKNTRFHGKAVAAHRDTVVVTDVILFHHAQGLTAGVREFADQLRAAGHRVAVPDLFDGATFDTLEDGVGHAEQLGFETILERGHRAAEGLPNELVYAGFSLGVVPAQMLAQTRPGARGALLFHACVPPPEFSDAWPADVPLQVHAMDADEMFVSEDDLDAARDLVETIESTELFLYPGDQHLFADASLPAYDEGAATLLKQRVLNFLRERQP
jgi:dienelactone hydrolase